MKNESIENGVFICILALGVLLMSYPRYVPHTTGNGKWDNNDINAVVDHVLAGETVSGFLAYPYSFLVRALAGGVYDAINAVGTRVYGGPDDEGDVDGADPIAVTQTALDNLSGTMLERISFKGAYDIDTTLTVPDNCVFDANAAKFTWTGADDLSSWILENKNKAGGNNHVYLDGGIFDGGNKAGRIFDFVKLSSFAVRNVYMTNIKQLGAFGCLWTSTHGVVSGNEVQGEEKGLGFNFFNGCNNISIANNVFNKPYDSAISIGSSAGVLCSNIAVVGNVAIGYTLGNGLGISAFGLAKDITITGNKISNMRYDGINVLTDIDTPDRITITGNIVKGCERNGIVVEGTNSVISGNVVYDIINAGVGSGIWIAGNRNTATGNNIQDCDMGIYVYPGADYAVLTGNICYSNGYGVNIGANCDDTIVVGNNLLGNTIANLLNNGTNSEIKSNKGYVTENNGTATILNGQVSVLFAHGLVTTPTSVCLGPKHAEVADAIYAADPTDISITVASAVTADRNVAWQAIYKP